MSTVIVGYSQKVIKGPIQSLFSPRKTPKGHGVLRGRRDLLNDPKAMVTFVVGLPWFMTPKCHRVIRGRRDLLYDPKGLTFVVGLTYVMTPTCPGVIRGRCGLLYDPKGYGDLSDQFDLVCKGHGVIKGRRDLLYDPKGQLDICGRFA